MAARKEKRGLENIQVIYLQSWQSALKAGHAHIPSTGRYLVKAFTYTSIYQASLKEVNGSKRPINQFTHPSTCPLEKRAKHKAVFKIMHCLLQCQNTVVVFSSKITQRASAEQIAPQQNDFLVQCEYDRQETKITSAACTIEQNGPLFFELYPDTRECFYFTSKVLK